MGSSLFRLHASLARSFLALLLFCVAFVALGDEPGASEATDAGSPRAARVFIPIRPIARVRGRQVAMRRGADRSLCLARQSYGRILDA